jgi:hypothetical protein
VAGFRPAGVIAADGVPGTPVKSVPLELDALGL